VVSSTVDHMIAVTVFLAATLLFIGLFNQTIQTAVIYQRHRATATKASDLLDSMLLSPGIPVNWGQTNVDPAAFGLQDPEFTQYKISPYSLMRLRSSVGEPVYYDITGQYYSNITMGDRSFMLVPFSLALNYSQATKLLGISDDYGFQLTFTPIVAVTIEEEPSSNPLTLNVQASGVGFPLSYATISYCTFEVRSQGQSNPYYETSFGTTIADETGSASIHTGVAAGQPYAFIAYVSMSGLVGMGYTVHTGEGEYVVPFIDSFDDGKVLIAHSYAVDETSLPNSAVFYNATFVLLTEDFTLREMPILLGKGKVVYGQGTDKEFGNLTIPTHNPGILVVSYNSNNGNGFVLMPWGLGSLAFPVTFGGDPTKQEWVATDMRHVTVGGIAYQAQIAVWSLEGYQVIG
jgi:hypothetical protein